MKIEKYTKRVPTLFRIGQILVALIFAALGGAVFGASDAMAADGWNISLTPRVGFKIGQAYNYSADPNVQTTYSVATSPEYGATIAISPAGWDQTQILVTGLLAKSFNMDSQSIYLLDAGEQSVPITATGRSYINRWDLEVLMRSQIGESNAQWIVGAQYVDLIFGNNAFEEETPIPGILTSLGDFRLASRAYILKGGLSGFVAMSSNQRHRLIAHMLVAFGYVSEGVDIPNQGRRDNDSSFVPGGDISVGYNYVMSSKLSVTFRYRAQMEFYNGSLHEKDIFLFHGPEVAVSWTL